jgi:hypothetical protein
MRIPADCLMLKVYLQIGGADQTPLLGGQKEP